MITWTKAFELTANETVRLPRGRALLRVQRGTVLVTRQGDLDDHVLEAGDELVLGPAGLAVAWAFTDAAIALREVAAAPRPEPRLLNAAA